jgi:hypothetical protein
MALDLSKLARRYEFDFASETLGTLHCGALTLGVLRDLEKLLADQNLGGRSFVLKLIEIVATHPSTDESGDADSEPKGRPVTATEAAQLSSGEIEAFAREFLTHNPSLLETYDGADRAVRTDDDGKRVVSVTPRTIDLPRDDEERDSDYLVRVVRRYLDEQRHRLSQITRPLSGLFKDFGLFKGFGLSKTTQDVIRENLFLSDRLGGLTGALNTDYARAFEPPAIRDIPIPENPIHKTNARLEDLLDHIAALRPLAAETANLIRSMNDASIRMLGDFGRNARRSEIYNWIIIGIAAVSLVVTAVFSVLSYVGRDDADARTDRLIAAFSRRMQAQSDAQDKRTEELAAALEQLFVSRSAQDRAAFVEALQKALAPAWPQEPAGTGP